LQCSEIARISAKGRIPLNDKVRENIEFVSPRKPDAGFHQRTFYQLLNALLGVKYHRI